MSILIKGMEMPASCEKCIYSAWSNFYQIYVCNAVRKNEPVLFDGKQTKSAACVRSARADNCPLAPVPPHGRCIDADELTALVYANIALFDSAPGRMDAEQKLVRAWLASMVDDIEDAPTIIPAEGNLQSDKANANNSEVIANSKAEEGET